IVPTTQRWFITTRVSMTTQKNTSTPSAWLASQEKPPLKKVLVIDDEENIIEFIRLGLRYEGFHVEPAPNGEQGIIAAQRTNPDLIMLDVMMPGLNGLEVCQRLLAN